MRTEKNTILVADPEDARREDVAARLERLGFVVDDVRTPEAAQAYLQARPDCALVLRHADRQLQRAPGDERSAGAGGAGGGVRRGL